MEYYAISISRNSTRLSLDGNLIRLLITGIRVLRSVYKKYESETIRMCGFTGLGKMRFDTRSRFDLCGLKPGGWLRLSVMALAFLSIPWFSPVQSLAAPDAPGVLILRWTATGDDGYVGQAHHYEVRWQLAAQGPLDTETEWQAATMVSYLPWPSAAGQIDSTLVTDLDASASYYFALRTYDEASNESVLSNSPLRTATEPNCCTGRVGDVNGVGGDEPTIGDIYVLIDYLFVSHPVLWCVAEADLNQSGGLHPQQGTDSDITIGDISILIEYLFLTGATLPDCL